MGTMAEKKNRLNKLINLKKENFDQFNVTTHKSPKPQKGDLETMSKKNPPSPQPTHTATTEDKGRLSPPKSKSPEDKTYLKNSRYDNMFNNLNYNNLNLSFNGLISPHPPSKSRSRSQLKSPKTIMKLQHYANFNFDNVDVDDLPEFKTHIEFKPNENRKLVYENVNGRLKSKKLKK